jgi:hypothetical protein
LPQENLWKIAVTLYNVRHDRLLAKVARDAPVNSRDLTKPNGSFRGMVDRSTHPLHWFRLAHNRTAAASFFFRRKLGQQVGPVPSHNTPYAVVYNIDAVEGLNLTADDFKVVWTEAASVEKFHWHARPIRESGGSFRK